MAWIQTCKQVTTAIAKQVIPHLLRTATDKHLKKRSGDVFR